MAANEHGLLLWRQSLLPQPGTAARFIVLEVFRWSLILVKSAVLLFLEIAIKRLKIHNATLSAGFLLFRNTSFSISTAKNTSDDTAQTPKNSYTVNTSVLNIGCKNGV